MQRIDENTYIDDTLVTCAEYQLFIDEMREQGKYYQPDHWTSYQFPKGEAQKPILGVRFDDAKNFGVWLTKREAREWQYRLAFETEVTSHPVNTIFQPPIGFWIINTDGNSEFAWAGNIPVNARNLAIKMVIDTGEGSKLFQNQPLDLNNHRIISDRLGIECEPAINLVLDRTRDRNLVGALEIAYGLFQARNRAFPNARDFFTSLYIDLLTLQERIAGRSPAFEGIRLVKERIR
jgi:hypothetical protein